MALTVQFSSFIKLKVGLPFIRHIYILYDCQNVDRVTVFVTAIRYVLEGLRMESCWRRGFPDPSRPALGPT
jgi:hypothetical protein